QLAYRCVIADNESIKLPLVSQHLCQHEGICRSRDTVDGIERAHQRADTRIDSGLERRQVDLAQRVLGKIGRIVVATSFRGAIRYKVFRAREDLVGSAVIVPLKTK